MKKLIFAMVMISALAGCASVPSTPDTTRHNNPMHQSREFKDLSEWEQKVILEGGGGE